MGLDTLVLTLQKHDSPKKIILNFLICMSDNEEALELGKRTQCHMFVINKLVENRDRNALIKYGNHLPKDSEDLEHLNRALQSVSLHKIF